ncbi:DUF1553 domain-containing protein [Gimesia panareensis]|uniref:DUF1553 domain-containing protein n=1 Tax=Gimesia panareensis TaxID=2527978 RepID=UPI00118B622F|nr:DUF1553 domain-containing protein [Gimesia panareensis]QDU49198.1 Xanthan lyase precursor [Gimesia panareensis]
MRSFLISSCLTLLISSFCLVTDSRANDNVKKANVPPQAGIEFFENKIRPVLVEHCYECHSGEPDPESASFVLDSRAGMLKGGDSGKAVVPGNLKQSLILQALEHDPDFYAMPPDEKLPAHVIADFRKWIQMGAPDPRKGDVPAGTKVTAEVGIDFDKEREFWSFRPLTRPEVPQVKQQDWARNDIDRFILQKLEAKSMQPAVAADRQTLVRRVYFDLTGLPPTPAQIQEFVNDPSPQAYEHLVDRLLDSPRFGETWGRHWLDLARYADSNGLDINLTFYNAWRYRDYVIQAFNEDKPYDQFIREQIAGDLLPYENDDERTRNIVATGFLVMGAKMLSERDKEKLRMDVVDEQIDVTGRAFMGMTLGCARCHDHKFDPIPMSDYYALAGIFRSTETVHGIRLNNQFVSGWMTRPLPIKPEHKAALEKYEADLAKLEKQLKDDTQALKKLEGGTAQQTKLEALAGIVVDDAQAQKTGAWKDSTYSKNYLGVGYVHDMNEEQGKKAIRFTPDLPAAGKYEVRFAFPGSNGRASRVPVTIHSLQGTKTVYVDQTKSGPIDGIFTSLGTFEFAAGDAGSVEISNKGASGYVVVDAVQFLPQFQLPKQRDVLVAQKPHEGAENAARSQQVAQLKQSVKQLEAEIKKLKANAPPPAPMALAVGEQPDPADYRIARRGNIYQLGDKVDRGFLTIATLKEQPEVSPKQSGRLELAEWLSRSQNPLTSRVMANRIWKHLFGNGLVRSVDNFGHLGEQPTHPELLDYLAQRFVSEGWSMKTLIREIMVSSAYRMSSDFSAAQYQKDPGNHLVWRMNRRRLSAESIRDSVLTISGKLDLEMGGSVVSEYPEQAINPNSNKKVGANPSEFRRSVYLPIVRGSVPSALTVFDFPAPEMLVGNRSVTTVPAQALFMMNSPFVISQAEVTAERILKDEKQSDRERVSQLYLTCLGREANDKEQAEALQYIDTLFGLHLKENDDKTRARQKAWASYCQILFASTEFRFLN